jgi:hypothetical protein
MVTGVTSIADERARLGLGFRVLLAEMSGEEELRNLGFTPGGGTPFIANGGRRPSSWASKDRRWIGRHPRSHAAAC